MINAKAITIPEGAVARILVGKDVIWKTKKIITAEDMLVKNTGADLVEKWNLTPNSSNGQSNANYFTFKWIPIEAGATYYSKGSTRSWFFDSNKQPVKTLNPNSNSGSGSNVQYQFVVPNGVHYISISYSYATSGAPENVYIRKVV